MMKKFATIANIPKLYSQIFGRVLSTLLKTILKIRLQLSLVFLQSSLSKVFDTRNRFCNDRLDMKDM